MRRDVRIHSQQLDAYQQIEAERDALRNLFTASERNNAEWNQYAIRLTTEIDVARDERDALHQRWAQLKIGTESIHADLTSFDSMARGVLADVQRLIAKLEHPEDQ